MTVASLNEQGGISQFSNYGNRSVQIGALGENIVAPILNNMEAPKSGTSMAAPLVAGVAAGIRRDFPDLSARDIRRLIESTATVDAALAKFVSTSGKIDPEAARKTAASWSGDNLAMLVEEARSAKKPGQDGPSIRVPQLDSKPAPANPSPAKGEPYRITGVSGSNNSGASSCTAAPLSSTSASSASARGRRSWSTRAGRMVFASPPSPGIRAAGTSS